MAYYNRLPQLRYTLKTMENSLSENFEIVIVDDYSSEQHSLDTLPAEFESLNFNIIKMQDINPIKTYVGPSIPYNVGFRESQGDKIIIQNPECCHMGDVLQYTLDNLNNENYLTFHCYAATKSETRVMQSGEPLPMFTDKKSRWYNHVTERPYAYHFTTAITRENLVKLNGFDEQFAQGHDMDDVELIYRVKALGLELQFVEAPWVVHQYHRKTYDNPHNPPVTVNNRELWASIKDNLQVRVSNNGNDICGI